MIMGAWGGGKRAFGGLFFWGVLLLMLDTPAHLAYVPWVGSCIGRCCFCGWDGGMGMEMGMGMGMGMGVAVLENLLK